MPWQTPSLKDVRKLTRDHVIAALGARSLVPNSALRIMSDAKSALAHLTLLYIDWLSKQFLPDTAETEWLDRHGVIWLVNSDGSKGRKEATFSTGSITLTGTSGVTVPIGTLFTHPDGTSYETTEEVVLSSSPVPVAVIALIAGSASNIPAGEFVSLETGLAGVDNSATVVELTGGTDKETDDQLRTRVLFRIQHPPMGGDADDYVLWALAVPGVTRAWSYPNEMGMGTVTVRFLMDELHSDNYGIPEEDDIAAVMAYLDTKRPVAVKDFFVEAPIPQPYDLTITGLSVDTEAVRARIASSINAMEMVRSKPGQTMYRAWVDEAISSAVGEDHHELTFTSQAMASNGHLPVLGTILYSS